MEKKRPSWYSIRTYITVWSLGFAAVLALAVAGASYVVSRRYLRENQRQAASTNIQLLGSELGADLEQVTMFTNWICVDTTISDYLKQMMTAKEDRELQKKLRGKAVACWDRLNTELSVQSIRSLIRRIVISVPDGSSYLQNIPVYDSLNRSEPARLIVGQPWFQALLSEDPAEYPGFIDSVLSPFYTKKVLPVLRPIYSSTSTQLVGWVYLELSQEIAGRILDKYHPAEDEALYLTIRDKYTCRYENKTFIEQPLPEGVVSYTLPEQDWTISILPSDKELHSRSLFYLLVISLIFLLILMAGFLMSWVLRRVITKPVTALLEKIGRVGRGDFSRDPDIEWNNELGDIGIGINELSLNVSALMEKKVQDEKERQELEYRVLQSQINPHFMYNTLNTIKWMAAIQGADGIADMSTALSRLLKNISKRTDSLITVKEEFALLDDYFTIMKYRYAGTIELEYGIRDESLLAQKINRFCVQPIVENAIFHGIEPKNGAGLIRVELCGQEERFFIAVTDNGVGMDEESIRRVLSGEGEASNDFFRQVGISNVNRQIKYAFGEDYGIEIESRPGEYTTMRLFFPKQEIPQGA
ncbi:MAG: sensor histidine kinase [Blautia sp.]|nr:sensor histidine kinase [Blautia sp.]